LQRSPCTTNPSAPADIPSQLELFPHLVQ